jgi:glycosyltransferase involved in cell wall biosynthesis
MISIVIPAYNEAGAIRGTIASIDQALAGAFTGGLEILVVDDGSTDDTGAIAAGSGATVARHPHNVGYGQALMTGIQAARHDTIVIIDADLTYPVDAIPALVAEFHTGFDMVVGTRSGRYYEGLFSKNALRRLLKILVEFTAGRPVPDVNSGLRVFSRKTVLAYLPQLCRTFSFTTSLTLAYMMTGRFVTYRPIAYHARVGDTKVRLFRDSLRTLQYIVQAIIYYNPIKVFIPLGLLALGVAVAAGLGALVTGATMPFLFVGAGLLAAIGVFALGLVAVLLRAITPGNSLS